MLIREVTELFLHNRKTHMQAAVHTIKTYTYALKQWTVYMEDVRHRVSYKEITRMDMISFVDHMRACLDNKEWSLSKYLIVLRVLKVMFTWMETNDDCREEELKSWKDRLPKGAKSPKRDYIPSPQDLKKWQKAFDTKSATGLRNYMIFSVFLETGIRRGELAGIQIRNLQLDRNLIYVTGKTGDRIVTITDELSDRLRMYLKKKDKSVYAASPYLFPTRSKRDKPSDPQYISQIFRNIKKRLGLPSLTPHTLRHCFATYYLINGGSVENLRIQTGHSTYDAMMHYTHLAKIGGQHAKEEIEKNSPLRMLNRIR